MSFVLRTNVTSFLFHAMMSSDVAFVLIIKQLRGLEWWFRGNVPFNLAFILSGIKGPATTPELFGRPCTFLLEDCVCGAAKTIKKKPR